MSRTVIIRADGQPLKNAKIYRGDKVEIVIIVIEEGQVVSTTFDFAARLADVVDDPILITKTGADFTVSVTGNRLDASFTLDPADTKPQFVGLPLSAPIQLEYELQRNGNTNDPSTLERGKFTILDDIA
jgi:hypothetical protein